MPFLRPLAAVLILLNSPVLQAQEPCTLVLSGIVVDDHDGAPLGFAQVVVVGTSLGVVADAEGRFRIEGLCPGPVELRLEHLGCQPVQRKLDLATDRSITVRLEHHAEELKQAEVVRERPDENVGMSRAVMDRVAMERASGRSFADMVATVPGVTVLRSGPVIAKPVVQGLSGNRVLTLNQGVRQEDQQWGGEHAPDLDPFSTDRIELVKGAASVQYGSDALGGVIITSPVELPRQGGVGGAVGVVGISNGLGGTAQAVLEGGFGHLSGPGWRLQGSGRLLGDGQAPGHVLSNTGLREGAGSVAIGHHRPRGGVELYYSYLAREVGILRAAHIGNLTDLQNAIERDEPWYQAPFTYAIDAPRQTVQHHLVKAHGELRLSRRGQLELTYAYQANDRQEYDIRRGGRSARPALDLFLASHSADLVLKHHVGPRLHGKVGTNGLLQTNVNIPGTGVSPLIPDFRRRTLGVFVLEHYPIGERLELEAGARLDGAGLVVYTFDEADRPLSVEHRFINGAGSLGANWTVADSLALRINVSSAFRPPHVSELYSAGLHHGAAAIEEGDAGLGSERMYKGTIDLVGSVWGGRLTGIVSAHAGRADGFIQLRPEGVALTIRGAFPVFRYAATDAFLWGIDGRAQLHLARHWSTSFEWSLVRGRDLRRDEWLYMMPSDRGALVLVWRGADKGAWARPELALRSSLVLRQSRFPEDLDLVDPPPTYHLLGLSAAVERRMNGGVLRIGLEGNNVLNARYRDLLDRFRYYADARGVEVLVRLGYTFGRRAT
ncbi:MAG TPA: TonB-dependent receptor [Flavobacteriales bacterium]|nr:TonB-dependent receptor [Flavobacteriales bacterium]HMR28576.1 TonB-dependent receptor [Flavobacteriales bacterium]